MTTFFTRVTLETISQERNRFKGKFSLDVGSFNAYRVFRFRIDLKKMLFVVYKDNRVFVKQKGEITKKCLAKHHEDQLFVLIALQFIFQEFRGKLKKNQYALIRREPGKKLSLSTPTPDHLTRPLIKACL